MEKRHNKYLLRLEMIESAKNEVDLPEALSLEFENHDNIFEIISKVQNKGIFENDNQTREFVIGLKMFSEVLMKNKDLPLFSELIPAFRQFMQKLKGSPTND